MIFLKLDYLESSRILLCESISRLVQAKFLAVFTSEESLTFACSFKCGEAVFIQVGRGRVNLSRLTAVGGGRVSRSFTSWKLRSFSRISLLLVVPTTLSSVWSPSYPSSKRLPA